MIRHVHIEKGTYVNSNVTFVDGADIYIGYCCLAAQNVVFATSGYPILTILREHSFYNISIHVGNNAWIGSAAQIMPGASIGDIPSNVIAFGVPCRVIREIGEKDREFYYKDRKLDVFE